MAATKKDASKDEKAELVTIEPLNFQTVRFRIRGITPLVQHKFSAKAIRQIMDGQEKGATGNSRKKREPRQFAEDFVQAQHISEAGWNGIPASALRNACISACRTAGYVMTRAKLSLFIEPDGLDKTEGTPLVKLIADPPEKFTAYVRNETGVIDIRVRPMWRKWAADVNITFDASMLRESDVGNLLERAGQQVGIGEGRPDGKKSAGMGWGRFTATAAP